MVPFFAVSTPSCNCRQGVVEVVNYLTSHGLHEDATYRLAEPAVIRARDATHADVSISFTSTPYHFLNSSGHVVSGASPDSEHFLVSFVREGDSWLATLISND